MSAPPCLQLSPQDAPVSPNEAPSSKDTPPREPFRPYACPPPHAGEGQFQKSTKRHALTFPAHTITRALYHASFMMSMDILKLFFSSSHSIRLFFSNMFDVKFTKTDLIIPPPPIFFSSVSASSRILSNNVTPYRILSIFRPFLTIYNIFRRKFCHTFL